MTSTRSEYLSRPSERRTRNRGEHSVAAASRPRRTGMVSEAVVAGYIRELAGQGRRVNRATARAERRHDAAA